MYLCPIICWLHVQLLVATGQGNIAYLEVEGNKLKQVAHHKLEVEVACLDLTPLGQITTPCVPIFRGLTSLLCGGTWHDQRPLPGLRFRNKPPPVLSPTWVFRPHLSHADRSCIVIKGMNCMPV